MHRALRLTLFSLAIVPALAVAACGKSSRDEPSRDRRGSATPPTSAPGAPAPEKPHGDHDAADGGMVLMDGSDHHAELVLDTKAGHHRVYVSDGVRAALPASTFDEVTLKVSPPGAGALENLAMTKATDDSHWMAAGKPVAETGAKVRLSYAKGGAKLLDVELPVEYVLTGKMPEPAPGSTHVDAAPHGGEIASTPGGHIELVADASGAFRVWLLDASLKPRAAAGARVRVALSKKGYADVALTSAGDGFEGRGAAIGGHATATVTAVIDGKTETATFPLHLEKGGGHRH